MNTIHIIGQIILGGYFIMNAFNHFRNVNSMAGYAAAFKVPYPKLAVIGTGILLLVGGLGILLNYQVNIAIACLILFLIPTSIMMHAFWKISDAGEKMGQQINFMKNMALVGALLMLLA